MTLSSTVMHEEKTDDRSDSLFGYHNITSLKSPVPHAKIIKIHSLDSQEEEQNICQKGVCVCVCVCVRACGLEMGMCDTVC